MLNHQASGIYSLSVKMRRVVHCFGGEFTNYWDFTSFKSATKGVSWCLRLDKLHAVIFALQQELLAARCALILTNHDLEFLKSFEYIPPLNHYSWKQVFELWVADVIGVLTRARDLDASYLFSRRGFLSQASKSRAFVLNGFFVVTSSYTGLKLGGFPVKSIADSHLGYGRYFGPHSLTRCSIARSVSLDWCVKDTSLRQSSVIGKL